MRRTLIAACVVGAVLVAAAGGLAVWLLTGSGGGAPAGPVAPPPLGALALAGRSGSNAVAITARPAGEQTEVTVAVIGADGLGANGLPVEVNGVASVVCGSGCYRALLPGRPPTAIVSLSSGTVVFSLHTVPGPAAALVARAGRLLRRSASTVHRERLSSGLGRTIRTLWEEQAPDRLSYAIEGGPAGIVIGARRWDRVAGGSWAASSQQPLRLPALPWRGPVTNTYVLAADRAGWTVAFLDRSTPAWFRVRIDRRSGRLRRFDMVAAAHFMRDSYLDPGRPVDIQPPR